MTEITCIVCPIGCRLEVDENDGYKVTGHSCDRGMVYGRDEALNPVRTITSTVEVSGGMYSRCPVKTKQPIPKKHIFDALHLLDEVVLTVPITEGTIVVEDICGTGIPWVTTRDLS